MILFLAANPRDTDRLALDREARAIHVELGRSGHRDRFDLVTRRVSERPRPREQRPDRAGCMMVEDRHASRQSWPRSRSQNTQHLAGTRKINSLQMTPTADSR
jgi:hypothetical protein